MEDRFYECPVKIRCSDVNRLGDVRPDALFDSFQEAANIHAAKLGCGFDALSRQGIAWVLARIRLDIMRTPHVGDEQRLRTWPSGFKRLYAVREALFEEAGGEAARLTSYWVLLDIARMRPLRLPESLPAELPDNSDMPQYFDLGGRLSEAKTGNPLLFTVPEHFIDVNGHANNARYWALVCDWLAKQCGKPPKVTSLTGHFLKETAVWSDIAVSGAIRDDASFFIRITDAGGEQTAHFTAEGKLA